MKYKYYVGIDVSKLTLDFSVVSDGKVVFFIQTENTNEGFEKFLIEFTKEYSFENLKEILFCMEHTGIYCNTMIQLQEVYDLNLWIETALQIKRSMGIARGKNDKIDSYRIATYAYRFKDKANIWENRRPEVHKLKYLLTFRTRIINVIKSLKMPLKEIESFENFDLFNELEDLHNGSIEALKKDLEVIDFQINKLIKEDVSLNQLNTLISSVDNIGRIVSAEIIVATNEFKTINQGKKFSCYSGVVPFRHESGSSIRGRQRVSHMANKNMKSLLHMSAMSAISRPGEMRDYYQRKVAEGKNKMSVINAIRNKLVLRVFACVRDGKLYEKNYEYRP
jgi:transposase